MRYLTAICTLILLSATGFGTDGKDVRHFEVNVIACDKLVLEGFDLGEVTVGEKIKLQLYMRNLTSTRLKLSSLMQEGSDVKFHSNDTIIEPQDGAILQATVDIPVSPSELKKTFQLSGSLSPNCEFGFLFKSTILGATCFAKKEWICEFEDSQAGGKVEVIIPLLLSNPADYAKLRARCDDSISFLTVEVTRIDDKPVLRGTFYPRALDRQRFRGQIFLEDRTAEIKSVMSITLIRKSDLEIYPSVVELKRSGIEKDLFAEAVLRSKKVGDELGSLPINCELEDGTSVVCKLRRMSDSTVRVYFELKRHSGDLREPVARVLVEDGTKEREVFFRMRFPN